MANALQKKFHSNNSGLHLAVFSISLYYVIKAPALGKTSWLFALLLFAFLGLGTIQVAAQVKFGELLWIDYRNFPGGPVAWYHGHYNNIYNTLGYAGFISANFLADAVLVSSYIHALPVANRSPSVTAIPHVRGLGQEPFRDDHSYPCVRGFHM